MINDFLVYLSNEDKKAFFRVLHRLVVKNESIERVHALLEEIKRDMNLNEISIDDEDSDKDVAYFNSRSIRVRRVIILELVSTLIAISSNREMYNNTIEALGVSLGLSKREIDALMSWAEDYSEFMETGFMFINSRL